MKFGKEFVSQMVPEWQEAYMNYNHLKLVLKDILRFKQRNETFTSNSAVLKRRGSLYRAFSGLTRRYNNLKISPKKMDEDQVILVSAVQEEEGLEGHYQTMFLMSNDEGGEYELVFFRRLDDEFNKVIKFYKDKVEEMLMEAGEINKQMDVLIALRIKVDKPIVGFEEGSLINLSPDIVSSPALVSTTSSKNRSPGKTQMDVIQEVEMISEGVFEDGETEVNKGEASSNQRNVGEKMNIKGCRPNPLEVLKYVKINIKHETPWSTLKGILMDSNMKNLTFTKEELREVEEQLKIVIIEFYQKLRLLKSYSFLNLLAFSKIMKKYDKITLRSASKEYLKMVDNSYIGNSEELNRLMERVEATFIKHFSNANRRKGINALRPIARREKHRITFLLGLLSGCSIALVLAIGVLIHAKNIFKSEGSGQYMETIFPLYSLFGFIVLHMLMYSANIYFWRRYRVNYTFIFGFKQGSELGYREVFLLSAGLAVVTLAGVLSNLDMDMDPHTNSFRALTELVPLGLLTVVLIILLCPFSIIYRSSRFFFIQCVFHCICAPLYKVTLPDFFLADQLTSQAWGITGSVFRALGSFGAFSWCMTTLVQAFRSLEFYICYYGWGHFKQRANNCHKSDIFNTFYFIVAVIPYCFRFLQCLRRLVDEKDIAHGINGLRYFSTIVAVVMRTGYELNIVKAWKFMAIVSSIIAALASTYWDIVIDWGLLQRHSKNQWLRDKLLVPHKSVYFVAMVLNVLLRFAWLQSVLGLHELFFFHRTALTALVACLEILRRGIWNFFRLENEHLNNVGKYRAFKSVPLPFNYNENDDKDE